MAELHKLVTVYFQILDACDGTPETFRRLYPSVVDLLSNVTALSRSRSRVVRYLASHLESDVSDMDIRFFKYTLGGD